MVRTISMILLFLLVSISVTAQTDNPDRYTSITFGAGFHGTYQTYTNENFAEYEWNRMVETPMFYSSVIIPTTDYFSIILNGFYQPDYNSNFDNDVSKYRPTNLVHKQYSYSLAFKFYIK